MTTTGKSGTPPVFGSAVAAIAGMLPQATFGEMFVVSRQAF